NPRTGTPARPTPSCSFRCAPSSSRWLCGSSASACPTSRSEAVMNPKRSSAWAFHAYMVVFLAYLLLPLLVMARAAHHNSRFRSVVPWNGFTDRWFLDLWDDDRMWVSFRNTILVAISVVILSVPIGTAAAILLNSLRGTIRSTLYGFMVAPILTPGAVIGI